MDSLRVPYPGIDDISHESSVYGGVIAAWTEEGASLVPTAPVFDKVVLEARKLTAYTSIPSELLQDAEALIEDWIESLWPAAISWFEDVAFLTGTGSGEPEGILNSPAAISVSAGTAHIIALADVLSMYTRLLPVSVADDNDSLVWLCSPDAYAQLLGMALQSTVSATTTPVAPPAFLTGMQAIAGTPKQLLGHPLFVSEKMPSSLSGNSTTAGALTLVDFSYYLLGDRQALQFAQSTEYLFGQDMSAFRLVERLDGRSWMRSPLTPFNAGPTLSPIVLLNTT
jgi:HK97 family phage major capsid protein